MEYKYLKPPEGMKVIFAEVVKPANWIGSRNKDFVEALPVGAITWINARLVEYDEDGIPFLEEGVSVHIEDNRYMVNFDPSSFQLLLTSNQKVK
jgi:hypothetical protein